MQVQSEAVQKIGNLIILTLHGPGDKSYIRLTYPLVPFKDWNTTDSIVLEKVVEGASTAKAVLKVANSAEAEINGVTELRLQVREGQIAAWRNGAALLTASETRATPLRVNRFTLAAKCWAFRIKGWRATDAAGTPVWSDTFTADSTSRYTWDVGPAGGLNALWAWGWYTGAYDSYRFVPGAVAAQLTSFTATQIRTPQDPHPLLYHVSTKRWGGNWVPRMIEQGVTATWGAVTEPYARFYAPGGNLFDHLWAGYNFAESFYIAENAVRWGMVAVGDPLYAPEVFAPRPAAR